MKYIPPVILAVATLCEALQKNPTGAKQLLALAVIGALVYVLIWVKG
jgi:hypothetical protein